MPRKGGKPPMGPRWVNWKVKSASRGDQKEGIVRGWDELSGKLCIEYMDGRERWEDAVASNFTLLSRAAKAKARRALSLDAFLKDKFALEDLKLLVPLEAQSSSSTASKTRQSSKGRKKRRRGCSPSSSPSSMDDDDEEEEEEAEAEPRPVLKWAEQLHAVPQVREEKPQTMDPQQFSRLRDALLSARSEHRLTDCVIALSACNTLQMYADGKRGPRLPCGKRPREQSESSLAQLTSSLLDALSLAGEEARDVSRWTFVSLFRGNARDQKRKEQQDGDDALEDSDADDSELSSSSSSEDEEDEEEDGPRLGQSSSGEEQEPHEQRPEGFGKSLRGPLEALRAAVGRYLNYTRRLQPGEAWTPPSIAFVERVMQRCALALAGYLSPSKHLQEEVHGHLEGCLAAAERAMALMTAFLMDSARAAAAGNGSFALAQLCESQHLEVFDVVDRMVTHIVLYRRLAKFAQQKLATATLGRAEGERLVRATQQSFSRMAQAMALGFAASSTSSSRTGERSGGKEEEEVVAALFCSEPDKELASKYGLRSSPAAEMRECLREEARSGERKLASSASLAELFETAASAAHAAFPPPPRRPRQQQHQRCPGGIVRRCAVVAQLGPATERPRVALPGSPLSCATRGGGAAKQQHSPARKKSADRVFLLQLVKVQANSGGQRPAFPFNPRTSELVVGRMKGADLKINGRKDDPQLLTISRKHCTLRYQPTKVPECELVVHSSNGVHKNGVEVRGGQSCRMLPGDELCLSKRRGPADFRYRLVMVDQRGSRC